MHMDEQDALRHLLYQLDQLDELLGEIVAELLLTDEMCAAFSRYVQ